MPHERGISLGITCRVLPRMCGALRRILERGTPRLPRTLLERGMQRIACSDKFGCIYAVFCVEAEAAGMNGALERATGDAAGACSVRDGELGHGAGLSVGMGARQPGDDTPGEEQETRGSF
jgi:hypothetical protein